MSSRFVFVAVNLMLKSLDHFSSDGSVTGRFSLSSLSTSHVIGTFSWMGEYYLKIRAGNRAMHHVQEGPGHCSQISMIWAHLCLQNAFQCLCRWKEAISMLLHDRAELLSMCILGRDSVFSGFLKLDWSQAIHLLELIQSQCTMTDQNDITSTIDNSQVTLFVLALATCRRFGLDYLIPTVRLQCEHSWSGVTVRSSFCKSSATSKCHTSVATNWSAYHWVSDQELMWDQSFHADSWNLETTPFSPVMLAAETL